MKILPILAFCLFVPTIQAQERTAAGTLGTQMTWSALKTLVDDAGTKITATNYRIDQMEKCAKKGLLYTPGLEGVDADGCKAMQDTSLRWSTTGALWSPGEWGFGSPPGPSCVGGASSTSTPFGGSRCTNKGAKCILYVQAGKMANDNGNNGQAARYAIYTCD